jgi:aminoglycoside 6'-N-acetyltransferase I
MTDIEIQKLEPTAEIPYDFLLISDPSRASIDKYIFDSLIYKATQQEQTIGYYALYKVDEETIEIKNIVVAEKWQGRGIGTVLLNDAIERLKSMGLKKVIIGTGNSSIGQLYLYQKAGFRISEIKTDFFIKNYPEPIIENGIKCVDMIVLTKEL